MGLRVEGQRLPPAGEIVDPRGAGLQVPFHTGQVHLRLREVLGLRPQPRQAAGQLLRPLDPGPEIRKVRRLPLEGLGQFRDAVAQPPRPLREAPAPVDGVPSRLCALLRLLERPSDSLQSGLRLPRIARRRSDRFLQLRHLGFPVGDDVAVGLPEGLSAGGAGLGGVEFPGPRQLLPGLRQVLLRLLAGGLRLEGRRLRRPQRRLGLLSPGQERVRVHLGEGLQFRLGVPQLVGGIRPGAGGVQPVPGADQRPGLLLERGKVRHVPLQGLDAPRQLLPAGRQPPRLLLGRRAQPVELLGLLTGPIGPLERLLGLRQPLPRPPQPGLRLPGGLPRLGQRLPGPAEGRLLLGEVGEGPGQPLRVSLRLPGRPPHLRPGVVHGLDPQQPEHHLLPPGPGEVREGVELLLLREDGCTEDLVVHAQEAADLRVHLPDPDGQRDAADQQLCLGLVVLAPDHPPHLVLLPPVLEDQPDLAVREHAVRADLVLPGSGLPVEGEEQALDEGRLPAAVGPEDPDDASGQLQVHLLEDPVVAEGQLQHPHTVSPVASTRNRSPSPRIRLRSSPARSCIST